ncbi:hypothetical protein [Achromobacter sp. Bel]|uniref:hypothetical protein n=1 Tax=Achromobacter sp. Bel TaxID=2727415 RepID=UPI00145F5F25|nr:hypothetical protein [Achromobacter sp. Bel]NMK45206.1 hypothetical protein [Achromobacter sp. Bel]
MDAGGDFGSVQTRASEALEPARGLQGAQLRILVAGIYARHAINLVALEGHDRDPVDREALGDGASHGVDASMPVYKLYARAVSRCNDLQRRQQAPGPDVGGGTEMRPVYVSDLT